MTTTFSDFLASHLFNEILSEFPQEEQTSARDVTRRCLDLALINQVLSLLNTESDRLEFITMYSQSDSSSQLLDWVDSKMPQSKLLLQQTAERTLLNLLQTLKGSGR